jgi:L-seryl-tRNA(Ser) seleniumtransferase
MQRLRHPRPDRPDPLPPAIGTLVNQAAYAALVSEFGRDQVVQVIREQIDAERSTEAVPDAERALQVEARLRAVVAPRLRRVINASGVILHTNLGRAPLSRAAVEAVAAAAGGYSNLELDIETGRRGERNALLSELLTTLFGCDAALVVNNNAAAVLLALTALCKGHEVIVSRGQLVEIGGSFRMPDVMRLSGARMVEVGTTNRTRAEDYEQAITPRTAAILRVHTSNFTVSGFTEAASLAEMAKVAGANHVLLIDDLGSGASEAIADEPTVAESLRHCDLVTFSGDKLLGGPQAGLVLGRGEAGLAAVRKMSRHPLARAVRIDKLTLAALEATLRQRLTGRLGEIPVERMLRVPIEEVRRRAGLWSVKLEERGVRTTLIPGESAVGGGSVPGHGLPTTLVALNGPASRLAAALRRGDPPVIARIEVDACCLDPRTVLKGEDETLIDAVEFATRSLQQR